MRRSAFSVDIELGEVTGLADSLGRISGERLGRAALEAVNTVTTRFDDRQRKAQRADINLTAGYIEDKTTVQLATDLVNPRATIRTRGDLTVMGHYDPEVMRDPGRLDSRGRPLGNRSAGVRVAIKPSTPTEHESWFLMKLKGTQGAREGVFVRDTEGKAKHLYGVSPYSLFRHQALIGEPGLLDDLETTVGAAVSDAIEKEL